MDKPLKQRMIGAVVLIALAVIFIPMLLDGGSGEKRRSVALDIPSKPDQEYRSRLLPLDEEAQREQEPEAPDRGRVRREADPDPRASQAPAPTIQGSDAGPDDAAEPSVQQAEADETAPELDSGTREASTDAGSSAPEAASSSEGLANWFVQVGSFSRRSNAEGLRDRLVEAGYSAFTESSTVDGTATYRVKVGPEMDRSGAERVRDDISARFELQGIVVSES